MRRFPRRTLSKKGLSGTLPEVLGEQPLQVLGLEGNLLSGTLPASWMTYAGETNNPMIDLLGRPGLMLNSMQSMGLAGNRISGTLPPAWGDMTSIEYMYLSENSLSGSLPDDWTDLHTLVEFELASNQVRPPRGAWPLTLAAKPPPPPPRLLGPPSPLTRRSPSLSLSLFHVISASSRAPSPSSELSWRLSGSLSSTCRATSSRAR